jgi:hypothetical protein
MEIILMANLDVESRGGGLLEFCSMGRSVVVQEPLNPRTNHGKIRISIDGRFWPLLLQ